MRDAAVKWLGERIPVTGEHLRELTNEPVPNHLKRWWFCLGGTPAYLFVVQIVTGILLAFHYQGTSETAYESVRVITTEIAYGWFIRGLHRWAATFMVAAVILHQIRVFFTGSYRRPREINWMIGMCLLVCTLLVGFTGYSLVYEQLSYWGATVAGNLTETAPVVGPMMKKMLLGGEEYNSGTVSRFYVLHTAILPGLMVALIGIHIAFIRMHGVTEFRFEDEGAEKSGGTFNFFPDHLLTELTIGLVLMIVLSVLATVLPATMGPVADPLTTPEVIKPEWYFYAAFRWLKLMSKTAAVLSTGLVVFIMFIWPFIDAAIRRRRPGSEISVWIGLAVALAIMTLTVWEAAVAH